MPRSLRRHRPTVAQAEAARLTTTLAISLGGEAKRDRRRQRRTQQEIGNDIGVDQARISQIERGQGANVPLELWVALGVALGRPLAVSFSKPLDRTMATPADAGHLEIQEALLALAAATGRRGVAELPTRPADPARSTDVALPDDVHRVLILEEAWNTFGDVGAAIRSTHRKRAEAEERAVVLGGDGGPYRVATVWIVRATAANRALVARYPHLFATTFEGSSRAWARALTDGGPPPDRPGLVWFEPRPAGSLRGAAARRDEGAGPATGGSSRGAAARLGQTGAHEPPRNVIRDRLAHRVAPPPGMTERGRTTTQREPVARYGAVKNSPSVFAEQLSSRQGRPNPSWMVRSSE